MEVNIHSSLIVTDELVYTAYINKDNKVVKYKLNNGEVIEV